MCLRSFLASSNTHSQEISIPPPGTQPDKKKLQDLALNISVRMSKILQAFLQDVQESCKNIFHIQDSCKISSQEFCTSIAIFCCKILQEILVTACKILKEVQGISCKIPLQNIGAPITL